MGIYYVGSKAFFFGEIRKNVQVRNMTHATYTLMFMILNMDAFYYVVEHLKKVLELN